MLRSCLGLGAIALFALTACPIEPPLADTGVPDSGVDEACANLPPPADGGVLGGGACNAAEGSRCDVRRMEVCAWDVLEDEGECVCASERIPLGERCDLGRQNCEGGSTCLLFSQDSVPTCQSVCSLEDGSGCEALQAVDPTQAFACAPVRRGPNNLPTTRYGVCFGVGRSCDPLADDCPTDQKCSLLGRETACGVAGAQALGQPCEAEPCQRGGLCVALQDAQGNAIAPTCYAPCNVGNPACPSGQCIDVGLGFGICFEG